MNTNVDDSPRRIPIFMVDAARSGTAPLDPMLTCGSFTHFLEQQSSIRWLLRSGKALARALHLCQ